MNAQRRSRGNSPGRAGIGVRSHGRGGTGLVGSCDNPAASISRRMRAQSWTAPSLPMHSEPLPELHVWSEHVDCANALDQVGGLQIR
jgi:hypothetical protein